MVLQKPAGRSGLRFLIFIPAVFLVFTRLWPVLNTALASFKDVNLMRGIGGSPDVGLDQYGQLLGDPRFPATLGTTLLHGLLPLMAGGLLALLSALLIERLRSSTVRAVILTVALLLSFLPEQLLLEASQALGFTPLAGLYEAGYLISGVINQAGIAILLGAAGICLTQKGDRGILRYSGVFLVLCIRLPQLFSTYLAVFEQMRPSMGNSSLFHQIYQSGLHYGDVSGASAATVVIWLLQLVPTLAAVLFMVLAMHRKGDAPQLSTAGKLKAPSVIGLCVLGALLFLGAVVAVVIGTGPDGDYLPRAAMFSLVHMAVGAAVFGIFALPGAVSSAFGRRPFAPALFILFTGLGGLMMEYYMARALQLINTVVAPPVFTALSLVPLAAAISYLFYLNRRQGIMFAVPVLGLALQSILTNVLYPAMLVSDAGMQTLPVYSYLVLAQYSGAERGFSGATIVLTLLCLSVWAFSCIPLFRQTGEAQAPARGGIPAGQFIGGVQPPYPPQQ